MEQFRFTPEEVTKDPLRFQDAVAAAGRGAAKVEIVSPQAAGEIVLTYEESRNATVFRAALAKVGGDYSKIRVMERGEKP